MASAFDRVISGGSVVDGTGQHELLIRLREGVEDIPHPVPVVGLPWSWESYPGYLDFLATRRYDIDVCGYVPHAAVRVCVIGQRGAIGNRRQPWILGRWLRSCRRRSRPARWATYSTSRRFFHRSSDGRSTPSFKANLNVLDLDRMLLHAPEVAHDLPGGGRRLVQRAEGYTATVVNGTFVQRGGVPTGALPGRLVRGPQPAVESDRCRNHAR